MLDQTALINAKLQAIGQSSLSQLVEQSRKYYENKPYPTYGNWPTVDGSQVYPKVIVPLPEIISNKSATFLMKRRPRYYVKGNQSATDFIAKVVEDSAIDLLATAETSGVEGGIWFKFYLSGDRKRPWKIVTHAVEEITPVYNPHNNQDLIMIRVQYKYAAADGTSWWYREEWTDTEYVTYEELSGAIFSELDVTDHARQGDTDGYTEGPWRIRERVPNNFGIIPFWFIKNRVDPLNPNGRGDYWDLFDLFDRINVTYDCMDQSNQFGGGPVAIFKETDNAPARLAAHEAYSITGPNADAKLLEHSGSMRDAMAWYAEKLESFAYSASQIVNPKLEDVAGLGQLSYAALQLLHGPLIELTDKKRDYWGRWGLCLFFERMLIAAENYGGEYSVAGGRDAIVVAEWPDYFPLGGVDKQIELGNIKVATELGLPFDVAAQWLARILGIPVSELAEFLKKAEADMEARQKLEEAVTMLKQVTGGPGGNTRSGLQTQANDGGSKGAARAGNA